MVSFESILGTAHVVQASMAVQLLVAELPWNRHWVCIDRFFRESEIRRKRLHKKTTIFEMQHDM